MDDGKTESSILVRHNYQLIELRNLDGSEVASCVTCSWHHQLYELCVNNMPIDLYIISTLLIVHAYMYNRSLIHYYWVLRFVLLYGILMAVKWIYRNIR